MSVAEILEEIRALPLEERRKLIKLMVDTLVADTAESQEKHSILELAGLGAEIWAGVDAQQYVNQLRDEWNHRP